MAPLLALVLAFAAVLPGPVAAAAGAPPLAIVSVAYPTTARAGDPITFAVGTSVNSWTGILYGSVTLNGPKDQELSVRLNKNGTAGLQGTISLSPNLQAGSWVVLRIDAYDADGNGVHISSTDPKLHPINIQSGGKPDDTTGPQFVSLSLPEEATMGDAVTIVAQATDELSGIDHIDATLQPSGDEPVWTSNVRLTSSGKPDEYTGTFLMDTIQSSKTQEVTRLVLWDKAGNTTVIGKSDLAANRSVKNLVKGMIRQVPDGLKTSQDLNLIYPGPQPFWNWIGLDWRHALDLLFQVKTDPRAVREQIAAELPQIRAAMNDLRQEYYVDPATKLKVSPYATTGKWMVLDRAAQVRIELLLELERRDGRAGALSHELTSNDIAAYYKILSPGEYWLPVDPVSIGFYGQVPAAILNILAQSPEAVAALRAPSNESPALTSQNPYDNGVIIFEPIMTKHTPTLYWGTSTLTLGLTEVPLTDVVADMFGEIGAQFAQAYFTTVDGKDRAVRWAPYLTVRNQSLNDYVGWLASAEYNFRSDFAYTFLPLGLSQQFISYQSFVPLKENARMAAAFKKLVTDTVAKPAPVTAITPANRWEVGVSDTFQAAVSPASATPALQAEGFLDSLATGKQKAVDPTIANNVATFRVTDATEVGRQTAYYLTARDADGRVYHRVVNYYRAQVMLDPVPAATNKPTVTMTGTAPPNAVITAGAAVALADGRGRFAMDVPLTKGINKLKVQVVGTDLQAALKVQYDPPGTAVALKMNVPGVTKEARLKGVGFTEPYGVVTIGNATYLADPVGEFDYTLALNEGVNKVTAVAVSPAGNTAKWSGIVILDSKPPALTVSIPTLTNVQVYRVNGKTEPGATVTLDDNVLTVAPDGSFSVEVSLPDDQTKHLEFQSLDAAGNSTTAAGDITYVSFVPAVTQDSSVLLSGLVVPGSIVTMGGQPVAVDGNGIFSQRVRVEVGRQSYTFTVIPPNGQPAGFIEYQVTRPYQISPARADGDKVTISGKAMPGYTVVVGADVVGVSAGGDWSWTGAAGAKSVTVIISGQGQTYRESVALP